MLMLAATMTIVIGLGDGGDHLDEGQLIQEQMWGPLIYHRIRHNLDYAHLSDDGDYSDSNEGSYDDENYSDKSQLTAFLLSFFLGTFGIGRFYVGLYITGSIKLVLSLIQICIPC